MVEENKRLKSDNEKLMSKLTQSKGVLKDTLDRLATNSSNETTVQRTTTSSKESVNRPLLPTASRTRIFSQAINACQLDKQIASITQKEKQRSNLKEEFLEFSRTHNSPKKQPSGKRGSNRNVSPSKHSNTSK